jgi:hypothetical protein
MIESRGTRLVAGDHALFAQQSIDQRRFADVGPADDGDADRAGVILRRGSGGQALEHRIDQFAATLAVHRGDCMRHAHSQHLEVRRHHVRIQPFGLVDRHGDGLAGAAQLVGDVAILGGEAGTGVGQEDDAIALGDGFLGLFAHLRFDATGLVDQAAGVDEHAGNGADARIAVLAVAGDAGNVGDDRVARARQRIEQRRLADIRPADDCHHGKHVT